MIFATLATAFVAGVDSDRGDRLPRTGVADLRDVGHRLSTLGFVLWTSDLGRARQPAVLEATRLPLDLVARRADRDDNAADDALLPSC
jgi:hypothetical protein